MKMSNKDLSSLADTTKATTTKINDMNEENIFNEEAAEEARSHPMALVIEDDKPSEINVVSELKKKNFLYKTAKTVDEGIEVYKNLDKQGIKIDVLFLDIVLKDKSSGIEFLKIIRTNHWMENTFIIVMSSLEDSKVVNECYKYKIENFLHKPIKKKEFQIEERKIFNHLRKMKCPIDGYSIVKLLDKTQEKESHLVRCEKTKELFLLKKIYCPSNSILLKNQDLLNELNNNNECCNCSTIIKLITSKILNKCNYLIMEYSEFGSLSKKILEKKEELNQERYLKGESVKNYKQMFDTEQILLWMSEIILALYSLHEKEIMHKNIKIENIYIFNEKLVKIKNIYSARINEEKKNEFNSLLYMPPEMFSFQEYTCYTDIWDLGIVLYELVMLEKPFQGINNDEIKNNIINEKYAPFPETIDIRLKRLLELTLAFINHRASAGRLLELKFIREKIDYLYKTKVIKDDALYKKISSLPLRENNYKFSFEKKAYSKKEINKKDENIIDNSNNIYNNHKFFHRNESTKKEEKISFRNKIRSSTVIPKVSKNNVFNKNPKKKVITEIKEYDYYRLFKALTYIVFLFPKKIITKGLFSGVDELIEEYYIRNLDEEWGITEEDIQNLIELRYIIEKKIKNQKFFTFELYNMKNVDNTINFPEEPQYLEYLPEPVTLTCKLLLKMKDVFKDCRYLLENEFATEKDKIKIITSKKIYHTYTCIKLLSKINIDKCSQNEKLSIILNLYQIMCFHFIIKQIVTDYSKTYNENKKNSLLIEFKNLLNILIPTKPVEITYNICGELITLYELKHIVLRRNRKPPNKFFKLTYNSDQRINFLDGDWEDFSFKQRVKILCLCFDPVDLFDDKVNDIMQPLGICFNDKTFDRDLDNSFHLFVKENIWIDDNNSKLNVPYFLKEYLFDLDNDENKMIDVLLQELYKDPFMYKEYRKMQCRMLAGKIMIRYYKEYDKPQRNA